MEEQDCNTIKMKEYCKGVHRKGEGCNLHKTCTYPNCRTNQNDKNYKQMNYVLVGGLFSGLLA